LEPNRVAFRVPVHLTKPEIRNYLRSIYNIKVIKVNTYIKLPMIRRNSYGDYFKNGPSYKKAIVTCEEKIPDSVKMIYNSKFPWEQPAITKRDTMSRMGKSWKPFRPGANRRADWAPRHPMAWAEPIATLLRGDDFPPPQRPETVLPDPTKPFQHYGNARSIPPGTPHQEFPRIDLAVLRAEKDARTRAEKESRILIDEPEKRDFEF